MFRMIFAWLPSIGFPELILIFLIILLLFGAKKLPEISRALGRSLKEFKKGSKEIKEDIEDNLQDKQEESNHKKDN